METTFAPLTHCPICRYDLSGLPEDYHCPECGFEYDASMRVWIARPARWWKYVVVACASLVLCLTGLASLLFGPSGVMCIGALSIAGATVYLLLFIRYLRYRQQLVISDFGITLTRALCRPIIRPWAEIWIPDPALGWLQLPPWICERHCKSDSPGGSHLMAMIRHLLDWVCILSAEQIILEPERQRFRFLRWTYLGPILQLPRKRRKAAMEEIREQWERSRHQGNPEEDGSPRGL